MQPTGDSFVYAPYAVKVTPNFRAKFEREAARNWDRFYNRNQANFFRDRHWTTKQTTDGFPCLLESDEARILIEAGCGAANFALPLLELNPRLHVHMFDFAPTAVELVRAASAYDSARCNAFVWDFATVAHPPDEHKPPPAHFASLVFVLSAVPPNQQQHAITALARLLRPGGRLLFRDYATEDMAQKRFAKSSSIDNNYFVRQDSTLAYFFDENCIHSLMSNAGLSKIYCRRVYRTITNRKEKLEMQRIFLQAEYQVPP